MIVQRMIGRQRFTVRITIQKRVDGDNQMVTAKEWMVTAADIAANTEPNEAVPWCRGTGAPSLGCLQKK